MKKIYSYLPESVQYGLRRYRYMITASDHYQKFNRLRKGLSEEGYSLQSFDQYHCIFIHVPKCAGQSIRSTLFENLLPGHIQVSTYQLVFPRPVFESYYKFTFVRNPWDRLVSAFLFMKVGGAHRKDKLWAETNLSQFSTFEEFVKQGLKQETVQTWPHFRPQVKFLKGQNGKIELDFIGRFENIREDFEIVRNKLRINRELLYINKTTIKKDHYRTYYTDELKQIAADIYADDIRSFDYEF